mgnify:CR=1 FL=1
MLRYLYAADLPRRPRLARSMFTDRAAQFSRRLGWDVQVNDTGEERDEYDTENPLYAIWELPDGTHGGSMRFLPTTGRTMVNDHFAFLNDGHRIESPLIWEYTRFCISPRADRRAAPALALAAGEVMEAHRLTHLIAVFDARMERIYRRMGLTPDILGRRGKGRDAIGAGLWRMDAAAFAPTLARIGVSRATSRRWLAASLPVPRDLPIPA